MLSTIYAGLVYPKQQPSQGGGSSSGGGGGIAFEPVYDLATFVDYPEAKSYVLDLSASFPGTIDEIIVITSSGTCNVVATINGSLVTGTAIAASNVINSAAASGGDNIYAEGDIIAVSISSLSNPRNVAIKVKTTRTAL